MVSPRLDGPGIRFSANDLMALRDQTPRPGRHRPASRRPGALPAKPAGAGMDLREIRAFAEGDDARRIDPAATARTGAPHIRSFHEDRDDTVLLIADFRLPMLWGTGAGLRSHHGARELARRGWQANARGASFAAISVNTNGVAITPLGSGVPQMSRISHMLASRHDQALEARGAGPSLSETLIRATRLVPPGSVVLIATGAEGIAPADEPDLARLARRRQVRLLLPQDPIDTAPPPLSLPVHSGPSSRLATLRPFDPASLALRMRALNVTLEVVAHDAG
jgi:uncharacterized protein (DUF58 family)